MVRLILHPPSCKQQRYLIKLDFILHPYVLHFVLNVLSRESVVLGKFREHYGLLSLVSNKDMTSWLDGITTQGSKRSNQRIGSNFLVAEGAALAATIAKDPGVFFCLILDQHVVTLDYLQFWEDAKLSYK